MTTGGGEGLVGYFFEVAAAAMTTAGSEGVGDVDKWGIFFEGAAAAMTTGGGEGLGDVDKWGILFEVIRNLNMFNLNHSLITILFTELISVV